MDKHILTIALAKYLNRSDFSLSGNKAPYTIHMADGEEISTDKYDLLSIYAAEELLFKKYQVRKQRDKLLQESDLRVLPDRWFSMTAEQQTAWSTYRQELRDITLQSGFPENVIWPEKP